MYDVTTTDKSSSSSETLQWHDASVPKYLNGKSHPPINQSARVNDLMSCSNSSFNILCSRRQAMNVHQNNTCPSNIFEHEEIHCTEITRVKQLICRRFKTIENPRTKSSCSPRINLNFVFIYHYSIVNYCPACLLSFMPLVL